MSHHKEIYKEAMDRKPTQKQKILEVLRQAGEKGVLNTELVQIAIGYRSRIAEMYQVGYRIDVENIDRGVCRYTLKHEPDLEQTNKPSAIQLLITEINKKHSGNVNSKELMSILSSNNFNVVRKSGSHKKTS
ncbi:hypothetical protein Q7A53_06325 [Halobacillus rhizosphaerae]|uniref:hypothetical protein n=1 Tax=Halobacillus rhizosphaerae TaxID=3064889 RepID=UPI00398B74C5